MSTRLIIIKLLHWLYYGLTVWKLQSESMYIRSSYVYKPYFLENTTTFKSKTNISDFRKVCLPNYVLGGWQKRI